MRQFLDVRFAAERDKAATDRNASLSGLSYAIAHEETGGVEGELDDWFLRARFSRELSCFISCVNEEHFLASSGILQPCRLIKV